jgi:hypothetical protein
VAKSPDHVQAGTLRTSEGRIRSVSCWHSADPGPRRLRREGYLRPRNGGRSPLARPGRTCFALRPGDEHFKFFEAEPSILNQEKLVVSLSLTLAGALDLDPGAPGVSG